MQAGDKIAVIGATGRVGRHVVDVVRERGFEAVPLSRSTGVDVESGAGLEAALGGVACVIDAASTPSPDKEVATAYFTAAAANLHRFAEPAGVRRIVVVSIIGIDRGFTGGYNAAKLAHERAALAGPVPTRIVRAAQFHEFVEQLLQWGTQGDVAYVPRMRTQLVAARTVAESLVDVATGPFAADGPIAEVAGPREELLADAAALLVERRGLGLKIEAVVNPADPDGKLYETDALLPSPHAVLGGPTFAQWLDAQE